MLRLLLFLSSSLFILPLAAAAQTVTIGDTNVESAGDGGNGNLVLAQSANLTGAATIESVSFYVTTAVGKLRLGIYDATGPHGQPGKLLAQTAAFTPRDGWNTKAVTQQIVLPAGNYWLSYLPSSNGLTFVKQNNSGACFYHSQSFSNGFPAVFSKFPSDCTPTTWSLYATLLGTPPPPVLSLTLNPSNPMIPVSSPIGTPVAQIVASWSNHAPFTGTLSFVSPYANDNGLFAISTANCGSVGSPCLTLSAMPPSSGATQNVTIEADQP